jgi:hypothetical protein
MEKYENVSVTSNEGNTSYHRDQKINRNNRLYKVLGYVEALLTNFGEGAAPNSIIAMHDHKGDLSVLWDNKPNHLEDSALRTAWDMYDGQDYVVHYVRIDGKTDKTNWPYEETGKVHAPTTNYRKYIYRRYKNG